MRQAHQYQCDHGQRNVHQHHRNCAREGEPIIFVRRIRFELSIPRWARVGAANAIATFVCIE